MKSVLVENVERIIKETPTLADAIRAVKQRYNIEKVGAVSLVNHVVRQMEVADGV